MNERIKIPDGATEILSKLSAHRFDAFLVGGCVRDWVRGVNPHDWDICTSAVPEITEYLLDCKVIRTGIQHGTVTAVMGDGNYEVTTFRVDGDYSDGRRPDWVEFSTDVRVDLSRRDFTMNAIAFNPAVGFIDPYGGMDDISKGIIRCVGNSDARFREDALRILRAVRFSAVFGFAVEKNTAEAMRRNAKLLKYVSSERICSELRKIVCGEYAMQSLLEFPEVIFEFIPELRACFKFNQNSIYHQYDVYEHTLHAMDNYKGNDVRVKLALLFHDIGKPLCYTVDENGGHFKGHGYVSHDITEVVMKRLRFDNATSDVVLKLVKYHDAQIDPDEKCIRRWLNRLGEDTFRSLLDVRMADTLAHSPDTMMSRLQKVSDSIEVFKAVLQSNDCYSLKSLMINGRDLISIGYESGIQLGSVLEELLNKVIAGEIENDHDMLMDEARKLFVCVK